MNTLTEIIAYSAEFHLEDMPRRASAARLIKAYQGARHLVRELVAEDYSRAEGSSYGEMDAKVWAAVVARWEANSKAVAR